MKWKISGVAFIAIGFVGAYILYNYATLVIGIVGFVACLLSIASGVVLITSEIFGKSSDGEDKEVESHVC